MNANSSRIAAFSLLAGLAGFALPAAVRAAEGAEITAVSSQASDGYRRPRQPDGSFKPQTYAFGNGGRMSGPLVDSTLDRLDFMGVARAIAAPLASQKYLPAKDPKATDLLIMVYWGATSGTKSASQSLPYQQLQDSQVSTLSPPTPPPTAATIGAAGNSSRVAAQEAAIARQSAMVNFNSALATVALEDKQRAATDAQNAMILGYDSSLMEMQGLEGTTLRHGREDLMAEVEDNRYFVVLMAYDFRAAWKEKKHKLLWVTRISVRQGGNDFGKVLPAMTRFAAQYFGQDTHGLLRKPLPEGHVDVGVPTSLGVVPDR